MSQVSVISPPAEIRSGFASTDRLVLLLCFVGAIVVSLYSVSAPLLELTYRTSDDAFYYFKVAGNIVAGHGPTFDQINSTNGFHPLWMLFLIPIYSLFGTDHEFAVRVVYCFIGLIAWTTFWVAYRSVATYVSRPAGIVAACSLIGPWFLNPMVNGLETGILILHLFLIIWLVPRYDLLSLRSSARRNVLLGVLLAVLFLCRLDSIFIVLSVFGLICFRWYFRVEDVRGIGSLFIKLLQVGIVALLLVSPYLLWNIVFFGHMVPISGALKTTFPSISFRWDRLVGFHSLFGRIELVFSLLVIMWVLLVRRAPGPSRRTCTLLSIGSKSDIILAVWFGCFLHYLNTVLFIDWAAWWWHYSSYVPMTVVLIGILFGRVHKLFNEAGYATVGGICCVLTICTLGLFLDARNRGDHHRPWIEAGNWVDSNLPADAVVGMTDCGLFGYVCGRPTVNLDGVINGVEYQEALRDNRLTEYLHACGVTHIADYETAYTNGRHIIKLPARLHKRPGGVIVTTPSAEIYRSDRTEGKPDNDYHFAIWKIEDLRVVDDVGNLDRSAAPF